MPRRAGRSHNVYAQRVVELQMSELMIVNYGERLSKKTEIMSRGREHHRLPREL